MGVSLDGFLVGPGGEIDGRCGEDCIGSKQPMRDPRATVRLAALREMVSGDR